jgi:hypothetical protein
MLCPNCKSANTKKTNNYFSSNPSEGLAYLSTFLKTPKDIADFRQSQTEYYCSDCKIGFLSPWLVMEDRNEIYNKQKRVHNSGWVSLENATVGRSRLKLQQVSYELLCSAIERMSNKGLSVLNYAEFNCPFSGPRIFSFSKDDSFSRKLSTFNKSVVVGNKTSISSSVEYLLLRVYLLFFSILMTFRYFRLRFNESREVFKSFKFISNADLIISNSSCFWSGNCVRFNNSCSGLSNSLLFKEVLSIESCNKTYDLIFASNVMDHVDNPTRIIESLMKIAKALVIQVHTKNSIGYQHLYALNTEFFANLSCSYDIMDLGVIESMQGYSEQGYLLINRQPTA